MRKNRAAAALLAAMIAAIFLAACGSEATQVAEQATVEPTAQPTVTPTFIPEPYGDFVTADVPSADPERLARFTRLLSLLPDSYTSALYLDMEFLRSNGSLASAITPEVLGLDLALPSIATGLVSAIAVTADVENRAVVTPFQSNFAIPDMIRLASSFGLPLVEGGPQPYEGHDVWEINALGAVLAMAEADEKIGIAATGADARGLAEASLDAFDGRSARLLDAPELRGLVEDVPSGFAAAVLSQCERLPLFDDVQALPGCTGAVVTADVLPGDLIVLHALIGFTDEDQAASAVQRTAETLRSRSRLFEFNDLGLRQEGVNLRVRVIVDVSKFADAFRLFAPSR